MHLPEIKRNIGFSYVDLSQERGSLFRWSIYDTSGHFEIVQQQSWTFTFTLSIADGNLYTILLAKYGDSSRIQDEDF